MKSHRRPRISSRYSPVSQRRIDRRNQKVHLNEEALRRTALRGIGLVSAGLGVVSAKISYGIVRTGELTNSLYQFLLGSNFVTGIVGAGAAIVTAREARRITRENPDLDKKDISYYTNKRNVPDLLKVRSSFRRQAVSGAALTVGGVGVTISTIGANPPELALITAAATGIVAKYGAFNGRGAQTITRHLESISR